MCLLPGLLKSLKIRSRIPGLGLIQMYLERSPSHFSHLFLSIIHISTPDPHWWCSCFTYVSWQIGLGEGSRLQGSRHEINHIVFLGMLVWEC